MIGSEGTLGLICEVDMWLTESPNTQQVMVVGVPDFVNLLSVLTCFSRSIELSAFEFFSDLALDKVIEHRNLLQPLQERSAFYALLEYDELALEDAMSAFENCVNQGWVADGVVSQSEAQLSALWQLREGISESIASYTPYKNDLSVRISDIPAFLAKVDSYVSESYPGFEVCWYGHIGDGNLHLNILRPEHMKVDEFMRHGHDMSPKIFEIVSELSGSISAEHGVGLLKKDFLGYSRSEEEQKLMRGLKNLFDPHQILNPGKLLINQ